MMPRIAIVSATNIDRYGMAGSLTPDDEIAVDALERSGMDIKAVAWNDPREPWSDYFCKEWIFFRHSSLLVASFLFYV